MVADEKFKPTTSISGRALNAENKVMVLPEPGGPHKTIEFSVIRFKIYFLITLNNLPKGLCSASQV